MTLPPDRTKTVLECQAEAMLLNYWYGEFAHIYVKRNWLTEEREYYDAETLDPLTSKQVGKRIRAYEEYMGVADAR